MKIKLLLKRWKEVLLITLIVRLILFVFSVLVTNSVLTDFFSLWIHWDGPHYLDIAQHGYQTTGDPGNFIVFYPFYPLVIKLFSLFTLGHFDAAAIIASTLFTFVTSVLLYELTLIDEDRHTGILAVWFLNIFPLSYFLQSSYTESLFLAGSLGTIYFFRKNRIFLAGAFGAAATATRVNGLLLFPLLIFYFKKPYQILTLIIAAFGFLAYLIVNYILFHDFFYFTKPLSEHWYKHLELPWNGVINLIHSLPPIHSENSYILWSEIVAIKILFFLIILVFVKTKLSYGVYVLINFLLFISTSFILSTPRYILILFPIYIALAKIKNSFIFIILNILCLSLLFYLTYYYITGRWAY